MSKAIARSIAVIARSIVEGVLREDSIARANIYIRSEQIHCFMDWLDDILALYLLCLADVDDTHFDEIYRIALQRKME